jgi:hypothetical protein
MFRQYIQNGIADTHRRIVTADYFKGATREAFTDAAALERSAKPRKL